ncbi:tol-pal system protein YbgF [Roseibium litorale]|uniref:Cell division coordinator CpoB n=1 Tax=Roseibium litorale TaxID=2803841 RepID=A0ABR9CS84_9HYPH|nr:tol-pal system protein YbgF [Roseibium litorale]MBD8893730.1 tol-pal system protein YbgF [Roseibium litorale]
MAKLRGLTILLAAALMAVLYSAPSEAQIFGRKSDDSAVRLNELEDRMRNLTGQLEQLSYQMREIQDQMRRMQEDNEYRFQQLEGGAGNANRPAAGKRSDLGQPQGADQNQGLAPGPQTLGSLGGGGDAEWSASGGYSNDEQPAPLGNGPIDLSQLAGGGLQGVPGLNQDAGTAKAADEIAGLSSSTGDPREDYNRAYSQAVNGDYASAAAGFQSFLQLYPQDRLVPSAQYWLGESLLAQRKFREAADAFLKTYTEHPGSDKSADSLLKLGVSLAGLGERDAACATFSELQSKYPNAAPAVLEQARDERRRAKCS